MSELPLWGPIETSSIKDWAKYCQDSCQYAVDLVHELREEIKELKKICAKQDT